MAQLAVEKVGGVAVFSWFSIQNRRKLQECIFDLLKGLALRLYQGMKLESGLWPRIRVQGGFLIIQTMLETGF